VSETKSGGPEKRVVVIQPECLQDLQHWVTTNPKPADRMLRMIQEALKTSFDGIGKPEALKHLGPNIWSRRLTGDDRLVYRVADDLIDFLQGRYKY
jgi:toxin YoeB